MYAELPQPLVSAEGVKRLQQERGGDMGERALRE